MMYNNVYTCACMSNAHDKSAWLPQEQLGKKKGYQKEKKLALTYHTLTPV